MTISAIPGQGKLPHTLRYRTLDRAAVVTSGTTPRVGCVMFRCYAVPIPPLAPIPYRRCVRSHPLLWVCHTHVQISTHGAVQVALTPRGIGQACILFCQGCAAPPPYQASPVQGSDYPDASHPMRVSQNHTGVVVVCHGCDCSNRLGADLCMFANI